MKSRGERRKPNIRGLLPYSLRGTFQDKNLLPAAESNERTAGVARFPISSVELLNMKTREKPRRARQAAAAARFFDESVRNSYARRATTPQTALWRQGEFRAEARKRWRRCVTLGRNANVSTYKVTFERVLIAARTGR